MFDRKLELGGHYLININSHVRIGQLLAVDDDLLMIRLSSPELEEINIQEYQIIGRVK